MYICSNSSPVHIPSPVHLTLLSSTPSRTHTETSFLQSSFPFLSFHNTSHQQLHQGLDGDISDSNHNSPASKWGCAHGCISLNTVQSTVTEKKRTSIWIDTSSAIPTHVGIVKQKPWYCNKYFLWLHRKGGHRSEGM